MRTSLLWKSASVAVMLGALTCTGCNSASGDAFRDAATDNLETAVNGILQGVASGVFEVIEPNPESERGR